MVEAEAMARHLGLADGNLARNLLEAARRERSRRSGAAGLEDADLTTITREDVAAALRRARLPFVARH